MVDEQGLMHCLLVPLVGRRLLVPRACIAEVIGLGRLGLREEEPGWLLGEVGWNDRAVPLVSFEAACGDPVPEIGERSRAVILKSLSGKLGRGGMALLCQGLPQLVRLGEEVLELDANGAGVEGTPVLCRVRLVNETPVVPDLELLEGWVAEALASS